MSLRWDAPLIATLAHDLRRRLAGARLRAIHPEFEARRLTLHFREGTLAVRLHPAEAAILWLGPVDPAPGARPLAARVRDVTAPADDRLLVLSLMRTRGSPAQVDLVLELLTNQFNAVLAEGPDRIVRLAFRTREGEREVRQGRAYELPAPSGRAGCLDDVPVDDWLDALLPAAPSDRRGLLLSRFAWTSPINAPALLGAAASPEAGPEATRAALEAGHALWMRVARIARGTAPARPVLLEGPRGVQPYLIALPGIEHRPCDEGSDVLDALATAVALAAEAGGGTGADAGALLPAALLTRLERHVDWLRQRLARLDEEEANLDDPAALRAQGDLLLARFHEVPAGATRVGLEGFDGEPVTLDLDPTRTVDENARAFYDRAARAERARERLPVLRAEAEGAWHEAGALLERARSGEALADEVERALPAEAAPRGGRAPGDAILTLPYRRYRSSGGLEIRVGRGSKRNDELTFHHSAPNDIWLHARHAAGAHVILRWSGEGSPPQRDLHEAGALAALHSKARTSGTVPVDWTRRKHVRKPRKAPAGAVIPDQVKTVFVAPDADLEERLRWD